MATITKSHAFGDRDLTLETGRMAKLADGAVVVTYGETQVLATCVSSNPREGIDFFPLTIDVEERMYAAGKIPGSFFRREGRPVRDRDPDLPADRPPAAAHVQGRVPRRGAGRHHGARRRRGEPLRHPRDERRLGRDVPRRPAVRRPGRLGAHGPDRRAVGRQPDVPAGRGGDVRRRRGRPQERRRRDRRADDRGRGARQHLGPARRRRARADRGDRGRGARGREARDRRADRLPAGLHRRGRRHRAGVDPASALRRRRLRDRLVVRGRPPRRGDRARQGRARGEARRAEGRDEGAPAPRSSEPRAPTVSASSAPRGSRCRRRSCGPA